MTQRCKQWSNVMQCCMSTDIVVNVVPTSGGSNLKSTLKWFYASNCVSRGNDNAMTYVTVGDQCEHSSLMSLLVDCTDQYQAG